MDELSCPRGQSLPSLIHVVISIRYDWTLQLWLSPPLLFAPADPPCITCSLQAFESVKKQLLGRLHDIARAQIFPDGTSFSHGPGTSFSTTSTQPQPSQPSQPALPPTPVPLGIPAQSSSSSSNGSSKVAELNGAGVATKTIDV